MRILDEIGDNLRQGSSKKLRNNVIQAIEDGITYQRILEHMLDVMEEVGHDFKVNKLFVPEVLIIGRAFNVALDVMAPFSPDEPTYTGVVIIGTVQGDLHNVGKNLVKILMSNTGMQVIDLGVDISPLEFIEAIRKYKPDVLAMSALLTITMTQIGKTIKEIEKAGLRENLKIIVGGAPVTENYARNIGADYYANDAGTAAEIVKAYIQGIEKRGL